MQDFTRGAREEFYWHISVFTHTKYANVFRPKFTLQTNRNQNLSEVVLRFQMCCTFLVSSANVDNFATIFFIIYLNH